TMNCTRRSSTAAPSRACAAGENRPPRAIRVQAMPKCRRPWKAFVSVTAGSSSTANTTSVAHSRNTNRVIVSATTTPAPFVWALRQSGMRLIDESQLRMLGRASISVLSDLVEDAFLPQLVGPGPDAEGPDFFHGFLRADVLRADQENYMSHK